MSAAVLQLSNILRRAAGAVWGTDQCTDEKCGYEKGSRRLQVEKELDILEKNVRTSQASGSFKQPCCNR